MNNIIIKSESDRLFEAIISDDQIDLQNEIIPSKVMEEAFKVYCNSGGELLLLHKNVPIGKLLSSKKVITNGNTRFHVVGKIYNDGRSIPDLVWAEMHKKNPVSPVGFSVSGKPLITHKEIIGNKEIIVHDKLELYEVSVICAVDGLPHQPANPRALLQSTSNAVPLLVKMMVENMNENQNNDESLDESEEEDEKKKPSETEDPNDIVSKVNAEVEAEAEQLTGSSKKSVILLSKQKKTISEQTQQISDLKDNITIIKSQILEKDSKILVLQKQVQEFTIKANKWKQMYASTVNSDAVIEKMLNTDNLLSDPVQYSSKQPVVQVNPLKQADLKLRKDFADKTTKNEYISQEDYERYGAAARRIEDNRY